MNKQSSYTLRRLRRARLTMVRRFDLPKARMRGPLGVPKVKIAVKSRLGAVHRYKKRQFRRERRRRSKKHHLRHRAPKTPH